MDPPANRLYVGNLLYSVQPQEVEFFIQNAGFNVVKLDMSVDPFTGRNPSYCFAEFASDEDAAQAMAALQSLELNGRPLKVKPATRGGQNVSTPRIKTWDRGWKPQQQDPASSPSGTPAKQPTDGRAAASMNWRAKAPEPAPGDATAAGQDGAPSYAFDRWNRRKEAPSRWKGEVEAGRRLWVGGLPRIEPQGTAQEKIGALFEGFTVEAISKMISPRDSNAVAVPGSHYFCFVDLKDADEANAALAKLNGFPTEWGGRLKVSKARANSTIVEREQFDKNGRPRVPFQQE